jgi:glycosyltransferase involved in cell wall biosynthesis
MFTIITPTYKRSEHVKRAIVSVQKQTHPLYTMIIVNDSPDDTSYDSVKDICENDPRITYLENEKNMGVNFSRNRALDVCADDTWVIFLDDDDELAPDALSHFAQLIDHHPHGHWFMANRALVNGASLTRAPKANMYYSYAFDYLITKRITGDATHCIYKKSIGEKRFSTYIKQGEEWLFFFQLGTQEELFTLHTIVR